jgi:protocatechuate 3,4-dioxygenase beta subunit
MTDPRIVKAIMDAERRRFLRSALVLGAVPLLGCGSSETSGGTTPQGDTGSPPPTDTGTGVVDTSSGDDTGDDVSTDATPQCHDTDDNIEGPFFLPGSPERDDLLEAGITGTVVHLSGKVMIEGCGGPLSGALLDFWQANDAGAYDDVKLRGHQYAGADGSYQLTTIRPGHYLNGAQYRPSHIHVKVGGVGGFLLLTTQLYFLGDEYNAIDPFIKPGLIIPFTTRADGSYDMHFDFIIAKDATASDAGDAG